MLQQLRGVPQLQRRRLTACRPDVKAASAAAADASGVAPGEKTFLGIAHFTWAKILPLGLMFFCILFNYTILRDTKVSAGALLIVTGKLGFHTQEPAIQASALALQDVLVVTAPGSGAEVIPFLKTWVNLPMAIGFTVLYAKVTVTLMRYCYKQAVRSFVAWMQHQ